MGPSGPVLVTLNLRYVSPPPPETPSVNAGMCMHHGAPAGIVVAHPNWAPDVRMETVENETGTWRGTLDAVSGRELRLAVRDLYYCNFDDRADGLWTRSGLTVNGVTVTRIAPLSASEPTVPAFVFTVGADGGVQ